MIGYSKDYCSEQIVKYREDASMRKHYQFVLDNLEELTPEQAFAINPYLEAEGKRRGYTEKELSEAHFYRCKLIGDDNLCTIHDTRPEMCSGFPWYGRLGGSKTALFSDKCGYMDETDEVRGVNQGGENVTQDIQEKGSEVCETKDEFVTED